MRVTSVNSPSRSKRSPAEGTVRALGGAAGRSGKTQRCHKLLGVPESRCALGDLCRLFHRGRGDAPAPFMRRFDERPAPCHFSSILCAVTYSRGQRCGRLWNSLRSVSHASVRLFCYILSHSGSCTSHSRSSFSSRRRFARVGAMAIDKESPKEPPAPLCPQCAAPMLLDRDGVVPAAMSHSELTTYTCRPCGTTFILVGEK